MTRDEIEQIIRQNIRTNGRGDITAVVMAGVLNAFVEYTDSLSADYATLVTTLADAFTVLVEELESKFEGKADDILAAFQSWADDLAARLIEKMDAAKASADAAKLAAQEAKTAAQGAETKAGEAKTAALAAETKASAAKDSADLAKASADDAKTASGQAKTAAESADTKAGQAKASADLAKGSADDAKTAAVEAKTAAQGAETKAGEAKTAAQSADTKAGQAKTSADDAKLAAQGADTKAGQAKAAALAAELAILATGDGIDDALDIIRRGNADLGVVVLPDGIKLQDSTVTEFPVGLDFSAVRDGDYLFDNCVNLERAPLGLNLTSGEFLFGACSSLVQVHGLSIVGQAHNCFEGCTALTDLEDVSFELDELDVSECPLTLASLRQLVAGLVQPASGESYLAVNSQQLADMEDDGLVAIANAKNWTVVDIENV